MEGAVFKSEMLRSDQPAIIGDNKSEEKLLPDFWMAAYASRAVQKSSVFYAMKKGKKTTNILVFCFVVFLKLLNKKRQMQGFFLHNF